MNAKQIADRIVNKSGSYQEVMSYAEGMISPLITRAESAEARAAQAEAERDDLKIRMQSWHDSAMTLADQRDSAYKRNDELESERDEARRQLAEAVAAEREACAKIADERDLHINEHAEGEHNRIERAKDRIARSIAAAIRARK